MIERLHREYADFYRSTGTPATHVEAGRAEYRELLGVAIRAVKEGRLPYSATEVEKWDAEYRRPTGMLGLQVMGLKVRLVPIDHYLQLVREA